MHIYSRTRESQYARPPGIMKVVSRSQRINARRIGICSTQTISPTIPKIRIFYFTKIGITTIKVHNTAPSINGWRSIIPIILCICRHSEIIISELCKNNTLVGRSLYFQTTVNIYISRILHFHHNTRLYRHISSCRNCKMLQHQISQISITRII